MSQRFNGWAILFGLTDYLSSLILHRLSETNIYQVYSAIFYLLCFFPVINIIGRGFISNEKKEPTYSFVTFLGSSFITSLAIAVFFANLFCNFVLGESGWCSFIFYFVLIVFFSTNFFSLRLSSNQMFQKYVKIFIVIVFYVIISSIQLLIDYYYKNIFGLIQPYIIANTEVHFIAKFFISTAWIIIFSLLVWISTWMFRNNLNLILYSSVLKGKDYFISILLSYCLKVFAS